MGEAKRRRQSGSSQFGGFPSDANLPPHYVVIVDQSPRGQYALREVLAGLPKRIGEDLRGKLKMFGGNPPPYTVFLGTHGLTGGTTMFAFKREEVLGAAIPAVISRLGLKSGLCAFIIALDGDLEAEVQSLLAEIQGGYDEHGQYRVPERLAKMQAEAELLEQPSKVSMHGGVPVSTLDIMFTDEATKALTEATAAAVDAWRKAGKLESAVIPLPLERMPDGRVLATAILPDGEVSVMPIPLRHWTYRDENDGYIRGQQSGLSTDSTPGKPVNFIDVGITSEREFFMVSRLLDMLTHGERVLPSDVKGALDSLPITAHVQEDGALIVTAKISEKDVRTVHVKASHWSIVAESSSYVEAVAAGARTLDVSRSLIETGDTGPLLSLRARLEQDAELGLSMVGKLEFTVDGYNDDPRFLHEIPEVCAYFRKLQEQWPSFLFFLQYDLPLWRLYFSLVCPSTRTDISPAKTPNSVPLLLVLEEVKAVVDASVEPIRALVGGWNAFTDPRAREGEHKFKETVYALANQRHDIPPPNRMN